MGIFSFLQRQPQRPPRRPSAFVRPVRVRGFASAKSDRLTNGWTTQAESINQALFDSLGVLRARSRDAYLNNDFVRRYVSMTRANVVGPAGIILQGRAVNLDGRPDTAANDGLEAAWREWGRAENCDATGKMTWTQLQHQAMTTLATDGEILARHIVGSPHGGPFGYKVQHLDPESLDHRNNGDGPNGTSIRLGIEFDAMGYVVAYHLRQFADPARAYYGANGVKYVRVPASEIVHAFHVDHVGQLRGYPPIATALGRLKMLDAYFEAALTAARAGASKMGFLSSPEAGSYVGDDVDSQGNQLSDFEAGTIERLAAGETFTGFDPRYPHEQFSDFVKTCLQTASGSMGGGVSYSALSGNLENVNFSSIRSGVLEEREAWKILQSWLVDSYCTPIYSRWLTMALTAGKIQVVGKSGTPATLKLAAESKYSRVSWQPRRWSWVDPQREMAAAIDAITNNITTVSAVIREQGRDPVDVFTERAAEIELMASMGLDTEKALAQPGQSQGVTNGSGQDNGGE